MSNIQRQNLGGATGSTSTGSSAVQALRMKTKNGIFAWGTYDGSASTDYPPLHVCNHIALAQNAMIDEIVGFEKRGMILLGQSVFASGITELHGSLAVEQAHKLTVGGNYVPGGGTCFHHAVYTMVKDGEDQAQKVNSGGYRYTRVYLVATDLDGDTASQVWGTTSDMAKDVVEAALATHRVTIFYFGVGGSKVSDHLAFATAVGIPGEFVYAVDPNTKPEDVGKWARHHFGLFSAFLKSKSVAIAAGQAGPNNLPGGQPVPTKTAWKPRP